MVPRAGGQFFFRPGGDRLKQIIASAIGSERIVIPASSIPNGSLYELLVPLIKSGVIAEHVFFYIYWTDLTGGGAGSVINHRFSGRWNDAGLNPDGAGAALADADAFNAYRYFTDMASGASVGLTALSATGASIAAGGKYRTLSFVTTSVGPNGIISSPFVALVLTNGSTAFTGGTVYVEYVVC